MCEAREPTVMDEPVQVAEVKAEGSESDDICSDSDLEDEDKVGELPSTKGVQDPFFDQNLNKPNDAAGMNRSVSSRTSQVATELLRASMIKAQPPAFSRQNSYKE